jgi:hypothetical protein
MALVASNPNRSQRISETFYFDRIHMRARVTLVANNSPLVLPQEHNCGQIVTRRFPSHSPSNT